MGLLDDAIREHLDLKRRHGADPTEIERAEREALGPVRRGPDDAAAEKHQDLPADEEQVDYGDGPGWDESLQDENDLFAHDPPEAPSFDRAAEPTQPAPQEHDEPDLSDESVTRELSTGLFDGEDDSAPGPPAAAPAPPAAPPAPPAAPPQASEQAAPPPAPPKASSAEPPHSSEPRVSEETAEYDVEGELDKDADDVLEETPEFLQDTPDHDRLWFEQRPPRDFDFDG